MVGKLPIGQKELIWSRVKVMVGEGQLSLKEASITLNVSYRQAKRIVSRYREQGRQDCCMGSKEGDPTIVWTACCVSVCLRPTDDGRGDAASVGMDQEPTIEEH